MKHEGVLVVVYIFSKSSSLTVFLCYDWWPALLKIRGYEAKCPIFYTLAHVIPFFIAKQSTGTSLYLANSPPPPSRRMLSHILLLNVPQPILTN